MNSWRKLIARRELAYNFARYTPRLDTLDALPAWAWKTIADHRRDAATHDDLWNATQAELRMRGKIHSYYSMYWGKKILRRSQYLQEYPLVFRTA